MTDAGKIDRQNPARDEPNKLFQIPSTGEGFWVPGQTLETEYRTRLSQFTVKPSGFESQISKLGKTKDSFGQ